MNQKNHTSLYFLCITAFVFYLTGVAYLTLFPIRATWDGGWRTPAPVILSRINFIPLNFGGLFELHPNIAIRELGGNILLTIPYGFGLPLLMRSKPRNFPLLALVPGLAIESGQLIISLIIGGAYRSVDINDVLLNTTGAFIGYGIYCGAAWLTRKR